MSTRPNYRGPARPAKGHDKEVQVTLPTGLNTSPLNIAAIVTLSIVICLVSVYAGSAFINNYSSLEDDYKQNLLLKDKEIAMLKENFITLDERLQKYLDEKLGPEVTTKIETLSKDIQTKFDDVERRALGASEKLKTTAISVEKTTANFKMTTEEAQKSIRISADKAEKVFKATTSNIELAAKTWEIQSSNMVTTLKEGSDTFTSKIEDMKTNVDTRHSQIIKSMETSISAFENTQKESLQRMDNAVNNGINSLTSTNTAMSLKIETSINQMKQNAEKSAKDLIESQSRLLETSKANIQNITEKADTAMKDIQNRFDNLISMVNKTTFDNLNRTNQVHKEHLTLIGNKSNLVIDTLLEKTKMVENKLSESIHEVEKTTKESLSEFNTKQSKLFENTNKTLVAFAKLAKDQSVEFSTELNKAVSGIQTNSNKSIERLEEVQKKSISNLEEREKNMIDEIESKGKNVIEELGKTQDTWNKSVDKLKDNTKIEEDMIKQKKKLLGTWDIQRKSFETAVLHVTQHGQIMKDSALEIGQSATLLQKSKDNLEDNFEDIKKNVKEMSLPLSLNHYITWFILVAGFIVSNISQSKKKENSEQKLTILPGKVETKKQNTNGNQRSVVPRAEPRRTIPTGPPVCDITAIAFTDECIAKARKLLSSVVTGQTIEYKQVTGDQDLSTVRPSRGYMVLIGFDARNAILEDMDGSMGRRKRDTITALQQTRGDVMVIYLDNDGMVKAPPERALYNPYLDRTVSHPILCGLTERGRLLTLRQEKWTPHQANHVKAWIQGLRP